MSHHWKHSQSGWTGLWATSSILRCLLIAGGIGLDDQLKVPSSPNYCMNNVPLCEMASRCRNIASGLRVYVVSCRICLLSVLGNMQITVFQMAARLIFLGVDVPLNWETILIKKEPL